MQSGKLADTPRGRKLASVVRRCVGLDPYEDPEILDWLPWMTLGVATRLRGWRSPRVSMLRRALFKLASDLDANAVAFYPWEPRFRADARRVPFSALFRYEPCQLMGDSLRALQGTGLMTVDDLRCLHPAGVALAKAEGQPMLMLYRALRPVAARGRG